MRRQEIVNYFQSDVLIFSPANNNNIFDERDYYRIWEKQTGNQFCSDGGYYHIIQPGIRNHYAGPDYIHALIQYPNGEILKGDVEIHTSVSDWYRVADLCHICPFLQIESRSYN